MSATDAAHKVEFEAMLSGHPSMLGNAIRNIPIRRAPDAYAVYADEYHNAPSPVLPSDPALISTPAFTPYVASYPEAQRYYYSPISTTLAPACDPTYAPYPDAPLPFSLCDETKGDPCAQMPLLRIYGLHALQHQAATTSSSAGSPVVAGALPGACPAIAKPKKERNKHPSSFCHICTRRISAGDFALICGRWASNDCRKVLCAVCCRENYAAIAAHALGKGEWMCTHCAHKCPPKSHCNAYHRLNESRKMLRRARKISAMRASQTSAPQSQSQPQ